MKLKSFTQKNENVINPVLLVVYAETYFSNLYPIAKLLQKTDNYEPLFIFFMTHEANKKNIRICLENNIKCIDQTGQVINTEDIDKLNSNNANFPKLQSILFQRVLRLFSGIYKKSIYYNIRALLNKQKLIVKLVNDFQFSAIILPADNRYDFAAIVKAGHSQNIPVCAFPAFANNALEMAGYLQHDVRFHTSRLMNKIVGKIYPKWLYTYEGVELIHLPAKQVLAREWLGLAPKLPWILHSGATDILAFECDKVRQFCINEGLPPSQLIVTGAPVHDEMAWRLQNLVTIRDELYQKLGLPLGKPMLLSALTPSAHNFPGGRPECDFDTYEELIEYWVKSLTVNNDYNVVIALHPSASYEKMRYIEEWGVKIAHGERTSDLIPLCDIFVASISSTIQWAIACGKPVLNYDVYRLRNTVYYLDVKGIITTEEKEEYISELKKLTGDTSYKNELIEKQKKCSAHWGVLDGQAGKRIIKVIDGLIEKYNK